MARAGPAGEALSLEERAAIAAAPPTATPTELARELGQSVYAVGVVLMGMVSQLVATLNPSKYLTHI